MTAAPFFLFRVNGDPAGQGNLKTGRHGKSYHANDHELRAWRGRVRQAAIDHTGAHEHQAGGEDRRLAVPCRDCGRARVTHAEILGPVRLEAVLTVARPKTSRAQWPTTRATSDWDHYARAIGDALTGVIYADDSQIVDGRAIVTYPHVHPDALHAPGAVLKIWNLETT